MLHTLEEYGLGSNNACCLLKNFWLSQQIAARHGGFHGPIFTATRSSVRDAGRKLAAMLLQNIAKPDNSPQSTLFEAELTVGQSTGPAPT